MDRSKENHTTEIVLMCLGGFAATGLVIALIVVGFPKGLAVWKPDSRDGFASQLLLGALLASVGLFFVGASTLEGKIRDKHRWWTFHQWGTWPPWSSAPIILLPLGLVAIVRTLMTPAYSEVSARLQWREFRDAYPLIAYAMTPLIRGANSDSFLAALDMSEVRVDRAGFGSHNLRRKDHNAWSEYRVGGDGESIIARFSGHGELTVESSSLLEPVVIRIESAAHGRATESSRVIEVRIGDAATMEVIVEGLPLKRDFVTSSALVSDEATCEVHGKAVECSHYRLQSAPETWDCWVTRGIEPLGLARGLYQTEQLQYRMELVHSGTDARDRIESRINLDGDRTRPLVDLKTFLAKMKSNVSSRKVQAVEFESRPTAQSSPQLNAKHGTTWQVVMAHPNIRGPIRREDVNRVVQANIRDLKRCLDDRLDVNGTTEAVDFQLTLAADGRVSDVVIGRSTLDNRRVERCMIEAVRTWKFAGAKGSASSVVSLPFRLVAER